MDLPHAIIFDFDQTIANTSRLEQLRKSRRWRDVYSSFDLISLYTDMDYVMNSLFSSNVKIAIVTNSPSKYCQKAMSFLNLPYDIIIGFHDTARRKPNPDPITLALDRLGVDASCHIIYGLGDNLTDLIAYERAHITPIACMWGWTDINPDGYRQINAPKEILKLQ